MAQLDVTPDGIDIAGSYQYPPAAPFPPNWTVIRDSGIRWVCHKATEGQTFRDRWFEPFWLEHGLLFRYRGAYAWPRADSGSFVSQMARTIDWIRATRGFLAGDFLMADVETTQGVRSWTDQEVAEGMEATMRYWGGPVLLYGRVLPGFDLVYANWTQAPNVDRTVVRQLGGRIIPGVSSRGPEVDVDYIVDEARMDNIAGYTAKRKVNEPMWIASIDEDLFLCGTSVWAITLWDLSNNPDVITTLAAQGGSPIPVNDGNTASRIRNRAYATEGEVHATVSEAISPATIRAAVAGMKVSGSITSVPGSFSGTIS